MAKPPRCALARNSCCRASACTTSKLGIASFHYEQRRKPRCAMRVPARVEIPHLVDQVIRSGVSRSGALVGMPGEMDCHNAICRNAVEYA